ncbi:MAG: CBS domain-containing protein [Pirellulaceae bacterium]|nr:CBS domain-containing protein [Pirellulaceae bacterium]
MSFELKLDTETIGQAFTDPPLSVSPDTSIREVFCLLKQHNRGNILVCDGEVLVGIFTERDALRIMAQDANLEQPISSVMTKNPVVLFQEATVSKAISMMARGGYRRIPVVDSAGVPLGVVKVSGILHYLVEHFPKVIYNLPPEPHHSTEQREGA